jgi:hypothetical protein
LDVNEFIAARRCGKTETQLTMVKAHTAKLRPKRITLSTGKDAFVHTCHGCGAPNCTYEEAQVPRGWKISKLDGHLYCKFCGARR